MESVKQDDSMFMSLHRNAIHFNLDMTDLRGSIKLAFAVFPIEPKAAIAAVTIWFISTCSTI